MDKSTDFYKGYYKALSCLAAHSLKMAPLEGLTQEQVKALQPGIKHMTKKVFAEMEVTYPKLPKRSPEDLQKALDELDKMEEKLGY